MTAGTAETKEISLFDSVSQPQNWTKLPLAAMRDVGPAVQTLGALLKMTSRETFSPVAAIAEQARLPLTSVRKHLVTLHEAGWIEHLGRQQMRSGWLRRTATIKITKQTNDLLEDHGYGVLPWWFCCSIRNLNRKSRRGKSFRLPWSAKALASIVCGRLLTLKAVADREQAILGSTDTIEEAIDELGGDTRFSFAISKIEEDTGLDRKSIVLAKRSLACMGVIQWRRDRAAHQRPDTLTPNPLFRFLEIPAGPGKCFVEFKKG